MTKVLDKDIQELVEMLFDEDEKRILQRFSFNIDGKDLTEVEQERFIKFLRSNLS